MYTWSENSINCQELTFYKRTQVFHNSSNRDITDLDSSPLEQIYLHATIKLNC